MNKINIHPDWKEKQYKALKELYELREDILSQITLLLNEPYVRSINKEYMAKIQEKVNYLHHELWEIAYFIEHN